MYLCFQVTQITKSMQAKTPDWVSVNDGFERVFVLFMKAFWPCSWSKIPYASINAWRGVVSFRLLLIFVCWATKCLVTSNEGEPADNFSKITLLPLIGALDYRQTISREVTIALVTNTHDCVIGPSGENSLMWFDKIRVEKCRGYGQDVASFTKIFCTTNFW